MTLEERIEYVNNLEIENNRSKTKFKIERARQKNIQDAINLAVMIVTENNRGIIMAMVCSPDTIKKG